MISKVVCLAALLAPPQDPTTVDPEPRAGGALASLAAALPQQTLAVVMVDAVARHAEEFRKTDLHRLLGTLPLPAEAKASIDELCERAREATGLDAEQLAALLRNGCALALTRLDESGFDAVLLARLDGDATPYAAALARVMHHADPTATPFDRDGTAIWTLAAPRGPALSACVHAAHLIAATSRASLEQTLDRLDGASEAPSLREAPGFAEFETMATADSEPFVLAFARPREIIRALLPRVPAEHAGRAKAAFEALRLQRITGVGYASRIAEGRIHDTIRIDFPEPRDGLLGALFGPGTAVRPTAAQLIPPGVSSFTISHLSLHRAFTDIVQLVQAVEPSASTMVQGALQAVAARTGVDIEQDLLRSFGDQILTLQWPASGRAVDFAMLIEAREAWRLEKALSKLVSALGLPAKPRTWRGVKVYHVDAGPSDPAVAVQMRPSFAVGQTHVVFATSEDAMRTALTQLEDPAENAQALHFLSRLPQGVTAASWTDLAQAARGFAEQLTAAPGLPAHAAAAADRVLGAVRGDLESYVAMDPGGITVRTRSSSGNVYALAAAAIGSSVAMPTLLAARGAGEAAAPAATTSDVRALLRRIAEAQVAHRESESAFAGLDGLLGAGLLESWEVGRPVAAGTFERDGYLVTVLLPEATEDQARFYAAMAWPADKRRGPVLASTPSRPLLINEVIAGQDGIRMVTAADLFLSGRFGTTLLPGWRDAPALSMRDEKPHDQRLMEAVLAAEQAGTVPAPKKVFEALQSDDPRIAARAAYALGALKATEGVPQLCEVVEKHADVEVRRHAMSALRLLADPRSVQASLRALESDDPMLRALAAANLGKLKAVDAKDALVAVAGRAAGGEPIDRVAALLALTDLGARDSLLAAAAAVDSDDPRLGTALTYMFQTLAPASTPADEAKLTMAVLGHPSTALRRYAIQRLGQLRDQTTMPALEGRLASEDDPALRPLIEVSLQSLRGAAAGHDSDEGPLQLLEQTVARAKQMWQSMTPQQRTMTGGGAGGALVLLLALLLLRGRRRRAHDADQWAAMTAPSDDFAAHDAGAWEDGEAAWDGEHGDAGYEAGEPYGDDASYEEDPYAAAGAGGYHDEDDGSMR